MNHPLRIARCLLPLAAVLAHACSCAGEVIAHPSVSLSASDVREVFLGEKQFAGGVKLVPVDNSARQADFLSKVMLTDAAKYSTYWIKKSFREGVMAPSSKGSDAEVIAFVKSTPGALGYVSSAPSGVKVLQKY
jgi:hypothetical protein